ncbi:MAG: thiol:disulfide interchange protein DsbD [Alteromonadaceae bacterium]|jgi:thiol:disulfide interchange protein DsbD
MKRFVYIFWLIIASLTVLTSAILTSTVQAQKSIFDTSSISSFSNDDEFLPVDEAFEFNFHQKNDKLTISFNIADGYYLYRHQFKFITENAQIVPVVLPAGEDHEDEFFGIQKVFTGQLDFPIDISQTNNNANITVRYQGCAEKGLCYPPKKQKIELSNVIHGNDNGNILSALTNIAAPETVANDTNIPTNSEQHQLADMLKQDSLLLTLLAFFVGGLLLSFTPCVFPMYPILTGIIVGQGKGLTTKKAFTLSFFYVQGMAVTYTILGIVVALAGAQFQAVFQHPYVLIALSALFIFLALSMFGVINLALPSSWQNKLNNISNSQKGGSISGVVMMGVISGLVASPCTTAPLTGALLYISQTGDVVLGASALYALSLGMGLPLLILGSSGGKILPKAGAWMNIIKNIFGLLLLAVPVFLLERIIPSIATAALWSLLIMVTAIYFYVVNQGAKTNFWFGLRSLLIFFAFFIGANQAYKIIYPPQAQVAQQGSSQQDSGTFKMVKDLAELQQAVVIANQQGKSIMVDLYADWCIACKEFEHYTFNTPQVQKALSNSVLLQVDLTDTGSTSSVELMSKYQVFGLPSILFFDVNGKELDKQRVTGFMDADAFAKHVNAIFN